MTLTPELLAIIGAIVLEFVKWAKADGESAGTPLTDAELTALAITTTQRLLARANDRTQRYEDLVAKLKAELGEESTE